jgi:hypothetical protein
MSKQTKVKGFVQGAAIAAAVASMMGPGLALADKPGKTAGAACQEANSCKGHGSCKSAANDCKGHNSCEGHKFEASSAKACTDAGGKVVAKAEKTEKAGK